MGKYYKNTCKLANPSCPDAEKIRECLRENFHFPLLFIFADFSQIILIPSITNGFESDLTLFLMTDYKTGLERKKSQKELDRMELQGASFHKEVYNGYLKLANDNLHRENFFIIDSNRDFKDVYQEVLGIILDKTGFK